MRSIGRAFKGFVLQQIPKTGRWRSRQILARVFEAPDWHKSQTFCLNNQEKLIFIDNRTEEYSNSNKKIKEKMSKFTWGKI